MLLRELLGSAATYSSPGRLVKTQVSEARPGAPGFAGGDFWLEVAGM
jgi:hypothetical protein